jgi:hypothetical protein
MIESQEFLNSTDVFVSTLRGFETVDQSRQVKVWAIYKQTTRKISTSLVFEVYQEKRLGFWVTNDFFFLPGSG